MENNPIPSVARVGMRCETMLYGSGPRSATIVAMFPDACVVRLDEPCDSEGDGYAANVAAIEWKDILLDDVRPEPAQVAPPVKGPHKSKVRSVTIREPAVWDSEIDDIIRKVDRFIRMADGLAVALRALMEVDGDEGSNMEGNGLAPIDKAIRDAYRRTWEWLGEESMLHRVPLTIADRGDADEQIADAGDAGMEAEGGDEPSD